MAKKISQLDIFENIPDQERVFTVSGFLDFVNELLHVSDLQIQGEITGWKVHSTGIYFSLKDKEDGSLMDCYMSPYTFRGLGMAVEDGIEVKVSGIPSIYKPKGRFSFRVESMELMGEGSLKKAYELLKKKLESEGLFDRKREVPEFIHSVGVITSKTGAVIDDFRKNLEKRGFAVSLYDVRVEGAQAVSGILKAIQWFNKKQSDLDILVIMRGGGSLEDLQAFNNELVVREIFGSKIPTICAIGHDRDVPIAQMVSDASPSTPTAAAMLINNSWRRLREVDKTVQRLSYAFESALITIKADVRSHTHRLVGFLARLAGKGRELEQSLRGALERVGHTIARIAQAVSAAERHLAAANPEQLLRLGYSIVTSADGKVVRSADRIVSGALVTTRLAEGSFTSEIKEVRS